MDLRKMRDKQKAKGIDTKAKPSDPKKRPPRRKPVGVGIAEFQACKKPRLPDGSNYYCRFDAATKLWHGTLVVPQGDRRQEFQGNDTGLFRLQVYLDDQYRAYLASQRTEIA